MGIAPGAAAALPAPRRARWPENGCAAAPGGGAGEDVEAEPASLPANA